MRDVGLSSVSPPDRDPGVDLRAPKSSGKSPKVTLVQVALRKAPEEQCHFLSFSHFSQYLGGTVTTCLHTLRRYSLSSVLSSHVVVGPRNAPVRVLHSRAWRPLLWWGLGTTYRSAYQRISPGHEA